MSPCCILIFDPKHLGKPVEPMKEGFHDKIVLFFFTEKHSLRLPLHGSLTTLLSGKWRQNSAQRFPFGGAIERTAGLAHLSPARRNYAALLHRYHPISLGAQCVGHCWK